MNNLAGILIKTFPKQVKLEDGTVITLRPLLKDDEQVFLAYFQSLEPGELARLKEEVTDPKVIESWMENLDYDIMLPLIALHGERIIGAASLQFNLSAWTRHKGEVNLSTDPQYRAKGSFVVQLTVVVPSACGVAARAAITGGVMSGE